MENEHSQSNVKSSYLFEIAGSSQKKSLYAAVFFSILSGLMAFVPYVMIFQTILFLFNHQADQKKAFVYGMIAVAAIILRFLFQAVSMILTHMGAYHLLYLVRSQMCRHIGQIELGYFNDTSTGEIKKVLMEDVERLENFFAHQIPDITTAIVVPISILLYLLSIHWLLALMLCLPIVLTFIIQLAELKIASPVMTRFSEVLGNCNSGIIQYVNGMSVMKTYHLSADSYKSYADAISEYNQIWKKMSKILAPMSAVMKVIIESGIFFVLPLGGLLYLKGDIALGNYIFFIVMSIVFLSSYNNLMNFAQIFSQISAGLSQIKKMMDIPVQISANQQLNPMQSHAIHFENVSFAYGKNDVLRNISLDINAGEFIAFVGASGAGKTTASQLIPRFWDVAKGSIKIDQTDIRDIDTENLMDLISFVFQETFMINDTIYQNIAIGNPDCTPEDVEHAAKMAQIHDFIMTLPDGYQTSIDNTGIKLSGGQQQRICIARAILKNAPIIIFDEATSFTDAENEYKIQAALQALLKGKTTIMIAHRLHTIVNAHQIFVFKEGEIVEKGKHETLLKQNGEYQKMWTIYTERRDQHV